MSTYNIVLSALVGTKVLTSTINRYTENGPDGNKVSTPAKIIDDVDSLATAGIVSLCVLKLWPLWFR